MDQVSGTRLIGEEEENRGEGEEQDREGDSICGRKASACVIDWAGREEGEETLSFPRLKPLERGSGRKAHS